MIAVTFGFPGAHMAACPTFQLKQVLCRFGFGFRISEVVDLARLQSAWILVFYQTTQRSFPLAFSLWRNCHIVPLGQFVFSNCSNSGCHFFQSNESENHFRWARRWPSSPDSGPFFTLPARKWSSSNFAVHGREIVGLIGTICPFPLCAPPSRGQ